MLSCVEAVAAFVSGENAGRERESLRNLQNFAARRTSAFAFAARVLPRTSAAAASRQLGTVLWLEAMLNLSLHSASGANLCETFKIFQRDGHLRSRSRPAFSR